MVQRNLEYAAERFVSTLDWLCLNQLMFYQFMLQFSIDGRFCFCLW